MFNKQGMLFYVASAILTNGRYTSIVRPLLRKVHPIALLIVIHTNFSFRVQIQLSHVVGGAPGYEFYPLPGLSRQVDPVSFRVCNSQ